MVAHERGEAGDILVADVKAVGAQAIEGGVHVAGVEQHQGVEDQAERADLVLHALLVVLVELASAAVEDLAGERVAALLEVGLGLDLAPVGRFVGQAQVSCCPTCPVACGLCATRTGPKCPMRRSAVALLAAALLASTPAATAAPRGYTPEQQITLDASAPDGSVNGIARLYVTAASA